MRFPRERWAAQLKAAWEEWERKLDDELRARSDDVDRAIASLAADEDVEPFQVSEEIRREAKTIRYLERFNRCLLEIEDEEDKDR